MIFKRKNRKRITKKKSDSEDSDTEILSQSEIDALLTAICEGETEPEDFRPASEGRKIKFYDFKRPDKFSRDQIRTISIIHERFSRSISNYFSEVLKVPCHVHVASVDQLTYEEFIRSIPTPTTICNLFFKDPNNEDDKEKVLTFADCGTLIEIDPNITYSIINYLTGGESDTYTSPKEFTELETTIIETPCIRLLGYMREAWSDFCDLRPMMGCMETTPQYLQIVAPTEMTVLVTLEVKIGEEEGMMNICYPYLSLEPILHNLSAEYLYSLPKKKEKRNFNFSNLEISLKFELFSKLETYKNLKNIKIGDIIWSNYENNLFFGKLKHNNIYLFEGRIMNPSESVSKSNKVTITKIKNILEKNYMESKNNVITSLNLNDVQIQLSVELGRTKRTIKDILTWNEGTIIELDSLAGEPVDLFANNVLIAKCEVVVIDESFGVRIVEMVNTENFKEKGS